MKALFILVFLLPLLTLSAQNTLQNPDGQINTYFKPVKFRSIGPFRGGRSVTASGVVGDPLTYYMGTTGGGLWKTTDAGQQWSNISDGFFKTGSVGAVAVSESDPNVVYCGMGEHAVRGVMTSYGDGVYKSTDAGKTWRKIGLDLTQHIARIVIHPKNPEIVYVAAQGALYDRTTDRGIYKSNDGGVTWSKILYVDDHTGCTELSMDLNNPQVLYAAMWEHQRLPWQVISGGPGSGLYKSSDAGATWEKIHNGLPKELGKMAVSVCRSNSDRVYALIESDSDKEQGGLFVSENAGKSWSRISKDHRLVQRAWYYIEVFADPQDEHTVYVMNASALKSIDGGKTWQRMSGTHGDFHDLWINPHNSKNLCIANDGGAAISFNQGDSWSTQDLMPTAQFYRVNVDNKIPYNIYGGQQDNTSVVIASRAPGSSGIDQRHWTYSAGGESAFLAFDPDDPNIVLGGSYLGTIEALNVKANAATNIMAAPIQYLGRDAKDMKYRFNWNAPIIWSKHEPNTFYHGSQHLLRTRDLGLTWEEASPDLTRNEIEKQGKGGVPYTNEAVGAENYGTLSYVIESPDEQGVIWTGSDDGLVYLTRDGGLNWKNVTPKGLKECLINAIDVSPHDPATAYIATTRYKFNDHTPGLYKTTDYGQTWSNISAGIPMGAYTRVVREDNERKDLLYAGTETGMYISYDGGKKWASFQLNLPIVPVTDLMVKHGDLIVATAGRSFWILDDLALIRQYEPAKASLRLFTPEPALYTNGSSPLNSTSESFQGSSDQKGVNPATGVVIYYQITDTTKSEDLVLEITDSQNRLVRTFSSKKDTTFIKYDGGPSAEPILTKSEGLNRFVWDTRYTTIPGIPVAYIEGSYKGHKAAPASYTITLKQAGDVLKTTCQILANPLQPSDEKTYAEYHDFMSKLEADITEMHTMVNKVNTAKQSLEELLSRSSISAAKLIENGRLLVKKMTLWDELMVQRKSKAYDDVENFPNKFTADFLYLINQTESDIPRVNQPSRDLYHELTVKWNELKKEGLEIIEKDIPALNQKLWDAGVGAIRMI